MHNKPAPYPSTDFQEEEAIHIFKSKIDRKQIKTYINSRDKVPNVDGYIEIIDKNNTPICKLEVQIKTIKKNSKRYYCPIETMNYNSVTASPILLILVDITQKHVYWKHLIQSKAQLSTKEKSYIFDLYEIDEINNQNDYLTKWKIIAERYIEIKQLIESTNFLQSSENIYPPKNLSNDTVIYFQKYIDRINYLLDHDYSAIKQIYFDKYWKLGVSVCRFETSASFEIYGIPYGKSNLLVSEIENKKENWMCPKEFLQSSYFSKKEDNPNKMANDFVLRFVKNVFDNKLLLPVGQKLTEEYVYFVISKCYYMFGLKKSDSYEIDDIENGFNKYLVLWVSIALDFIDYPKYPSYPKNINVIDIVYMADILSYFSDFSDKYYAIAQTFNKVISGQEQHKIKENIKFHSKSFDFYIFINSLNYLKNHNIKKVENFLIERNYDLVKNKNSYMLLELYAPEDRKKYILKFYATIQTVVNEFVDYYKLPKEYKIYSNEKYHYFIIPYIETQVRNGISTEYASTSVIITERYEDEICNVTIIENEESINDLIPREEFFLYGDRKYKIISWSNKSDNEIFGIIPLYNRVYSHLQEVARKIKEKMRKCELF